MILLSCRNWQKKEETGRVTFSCIADFAASRPSRYSGVYNRCCNPSRGRDVSVLQLPGRTFMYLLGVQPLYERLALSFKMDGKGVGWGC
jgi:hypothetical protein